MKEGWRDTSIGDVCDVVNGGTPKTNVATFWGGKHMWITPAEMGRRSDPYVDTTARRLTDAGLTAANLLPAYSVILSSRAPIGHLVINSIPMATNQGCKGLVPKPSIHFKYLYYYLGSVVGLLNDLGTGATFKELSGGKLKEVPIPLPPLSEQHRIVAILDEAFAGLATAIANAEKNLKNARDLFEGSVSAVFTAKGDDWISLQIGDVATTQYGLSGTLNSDGVGYRIFRMGEVQRGAMVDSGRMKYINIDRAEFESYRLRRGDILFNRTNSVDLVGKTGRFDLEGDYCFASYLIRVTFDPEKMDSRFAAYLMNANDFLARIRSKAARSVNQANINATILRGQKIDLPSSVQLQRKFADKFDELSSAARRLEKHYETRMLELESLKQSILQKAFSGELTAPPLSAIKEAAE
ncbi:restriction endonuclease subunit S [Rhodopseudomonas telluris]|uniref:Restriction endonuclease subunit S n=1 Tax=Rhodopseudomonas telluris TaxID=644215 RepID=A0ABV6ENP0_9BRAD